ncbi:MAG: 4-(cytidine 5'-diphospho)-2-C-methyl-D-erythritol kinase [Candidatus Omnitrophica bacterium]|nr:4-(cytidine 5'-diphospho)-2-C-methyl-D-erythritol kinase [Candidatus Omnitrophota bacterium]
MSTHFELPSPAKINLFLDVLKKRSDGYHEIVTVFEKIDLCDRITFYPIPDEPQARESIRVTSNTTELPIDENNLVYRACSLLKNRYGISKSVRIHIEKNIPIAAGLGGGSSNAATVLKGLNRLWKLGLSVDELCDLGKEIGADVPFFIFNNAFAVGMGRGDDIRPIDSDLEMWHVLICPPYKVLTKEVYGNASLGLTQSGADVKILTRAIEKSDAEEVGERLYNALEHIVTKQVTEISGAKDLVNRWGFNAAGVTGSGPTIFVLAFKRKEAVELKKRLADSFASDESRREWKIFVAKTATTERKE